MCDVNENGIKRNIYENKLLDNDKKNLNNKNGLNLGLENNTNNNSFDITLNEPTIIQNNDEFDEQISLNDLEEPKISNLKLPVREKKNNLLFNMKLTNDSKNLKMSPDDLNPITSAPKINQQNYTTLNSHNSNYRINSGKKSAFTDEKGYEKYSRYSKAKTTVPGNNNNKIGIEKIEKFENFDTVQMKYNYVKDYSNLHVDLNENFMHRMQFDIYKRQNRDDRLDKLVEANKMKIDESERIKTFNHLIEDANRRLIAQDNLNNNKIKLSSDLTNKNQKKYNENQWKNIYNQRFKTFEENKNKKIEDSIRYKKNIETRKLIEETGGVKKLISSNSKEVIQSIIQNTSQRLYDDAKKRKIKKNQKNIINNQYILAEKEDNPYKFMKKIKGQEYNFKEDNDINNLIIETKNNKNNFNKVDYIPKSDMKKKKKMTVTEFNNKRFNNTARKEFYSQQPNSYFNKSNQFYDNKNYDFIDEKNKLMQMAAVKRLQPVSLKDQFFLNQCIDDSGLQKSIGINQNQTNNLDFQEELQGPEKISSESLIEATKIVDQFFSANLNKH